MRSLLAVLVATAVVCSTASDASATPCPRNGGTLCNVPGDVSQVAATWYTLDFTNPSGPENYGSVMHVAWADDRNAATSDTDIFMDYYASCLDSTGGQAGTSVVTAPGEQSSPVIIQSGIAPPSRFEPNDFGVIVAWVDRRGIDADIYARRFYGAAPHPPWDTAEIPICNADGDQTSPVMVRSERGGAVLGWIDGRSGTLQIYAQLVDSAGIGLWGSNGIPVSPTAGDQELLQAAADGAGGAYFCWLDHRSGSALYAMRFTREGLPASGWNADGNLVADGVQVTGGPRIVVDAGGLAVSWTDARDDPDGDVFAQRLGTNGSAVAGWSASGNALAAGSGAQRMDDFVSDGAGGCYVVWESEQAGGDVDLYASRLDAGGAVVSGWPAVVSAAAGRQDHARAVGVGDLFVIFSDDRSGVRDIYAMRRRPDGTVPTGSWIANGILVSGARDVQDFPIAVPSPYRGDIHSAWIDYRDRTVNGSDLYGASIHVDGAVDVPRALAPVRVTLGAPRPNPAHAGTSMSLDLTASGRVDVDVLDCAGRKVRSLLSETLPAGRREVAWDGRTDRGSMSGPGVYFVHARIGNESLQRPLVVTR
jgi:hypothetical protein